MERENAIDVKDLHISYKCLEIFFYKEKSASAEKDGYRSI